MTPSPEGLKFQGLFFCLMARIEQGIFVPLVLSQCVSPIPAEDVVVDDDAVRRSLIRIVESGGYEFTPI